MDRKEYICRVNARSLNHFYNHCQDGVCRKSRREEWGGRAGRGWRRGEGVEWARGRAWYGDEGRQQEHNQPNVSVQYIMY